MVAFSTPIVRSLYGAEAWRHFIPFKVAACVHIKFVLKLPRHQRWSQTAYGLLVAYLVQKFVLTFYVDSGDGGLILPAVWLAGCSRCASRGATCLTSRRPLSRHAPPGV